MTSNVEKALTLGVGATVVIALLVASRKKDPTIVTPVIKELLKESEKIRYDWNKVKDSVQDNLDAANKEFSEAGKSTTKGIVTGKVVDINKVVKNLKEATDKLAKDDTTKRAIENTKKLTKEAKKQIDKSRKILDLTREIEDIKTKINETKAEIEKNTAYTGPAIGGVASRYVAQAKQLIPGADRIR